MAGVYVYAREIPYMEQGTRLRLVSSAENNRLVLGHFSTLDLTDNGTGSGVAEAVVNGTSADPAFDKVLATIDLAEWYEENGRDIPPADLYKTVSLAMLAVEPAHA